MLSFRLTHPVDAIRVESRYLLGRSADVLETMQELHLGWYDVEASFSELQRRSSGGLIRKLGSKELNDGLLSAENLIVRPQLR
jgi:hypothetical protein